MNDNSSENSNDSFEGKQKILNKNKLKKEHIKLLKDALEDKEEQMEQMKKLMVEDEELKQNLKEKIDELTKKLNEVQAGFNDDLNDDELDKLLGRDNAAVDLFNTEELVDSNPMKDNLTEPPKTDFDFVMGGNAMMNDYATRIRALRGRTCWGRFKLFLEDTVDFFTPFKSDIYYLSSRYDRNVSGVFRFLRFLYTMQCVIS